MRLQIFLSHSGVCSRREALKSIENNQVRVNGKIINEPSFDVDIIKDKISVKGKIIYLPKKTYIKMNKPKGVVTTRKDRYAKRTVADLLPDKFDHLYPVGRLDKDTEGLLLLTNDGELTYRLTHPRFKIKKIYLALVKGFISSLKKKRLESGIILQGVRTAPCNLEVISFWRNLSKVKITLFEGRKRQIKEMFRHIGNPVIKLKRIQEASLQLGDLSTGKWYLLSKKEIESLYKEAGLKFYG